MRKKGHKATILLQQNITYKVLLDTFLHLRKSICFFPCLHRKPMLLCLSSAPQGTCLTQYLYVSTKKIGYSMFSCLFILCQLPNMTAAIPSPTLLPRMQVSILMVEVKAEILSGCQQIVFTLD